MYVELFVELVPFVVAFGVVVEEAIIMPLNKKKLKYQTNFEKKIDIFWQLPCLPPSKRKDNNKKLNTRIVLLIQLHFILRRLINGRRGNAYGCCIIHATIKIVLLLFVVVVVGR